MWSVQGRILLYSITLVLFTLSEVFARSSLGDWKRIPSVPDYPPPTFRIYVRDPNFPSPDVTGRRLQEAFLDMWHLAAVACATLDDEEDVYERYFEPGESEMVQHNLPAALIHHKIFCNVAGIDDPESCDLFTTSLISNVHMQDLTIIAGLATAGEIPPSEQPDLNNPDLDLFCTTFQDRGPQDNKAYTQVYQRAFDFPSLGEIFTKRTCIGLGPYDSGLMTSLGAHLLHEMIHWRQLVRSSNNQEQFDAVVKHTVFVPNPNNEDDPEEEERDYIDDYDRNLYEDPDLDPATGYGPANAHELVINGDDASFRNADNYRWYAVSKYWSWKCTQAAGGQKIVFGQQDDNELGDGLIPKGCDGRIPCP